MSRMLATLADSEGIYLEPSALAGMYGPVLMETRPEFKEYIEMEGLSGKLADGIHLVWATGGSMVPKEEMEKYYLRGKECQESLHTPKG